MSQFNGGTSGLRCGCFFFLSCESSWQPVGLILALCWSNPTQAGGGRGVRNNALAGAFGGKGLFSARKVRMKLNLSAPRVYDKQQETNQEERKIRTLICGIEGAYRTTTTTV